ncbi:MAG: NADH-quinone oxidoreductase subunit M [Magnetococcales bacterium]|nr:NADH-quinone oxidoreductase subunit M [Magnetococcales bacterium]
MMTEIAWSEQSRWPILAVLQCFPLLAALLLSRVRNDWQAFCLGIVLAVIELFGAIQLYQQYDPQQAAWQLAERLTILGPFAYHAAADGMSVLFILLTTFLTCMAIPYGWVRPFRPQPHFLTILFCAEAVLISQFATVDLFWFLICSVLQIALVGHLMQRWSASADERLSLNRFFQFMGIGLSMLLAGTLILGWSHFDQTGRWSFDLLDLLANPLHSFLNVSVFFLLFYGLGIRVPLFPLHGWLPLVAERGTVVLALVILLGVKTGFYGMLRFMMPLLPASVYRWQWEVVMIATIGIFYAAWLATMQQNLRRMMAYAVISHTDIIVIGLFTTHAHALQGSLLLIGNVGLAAATLFFMIGLINRRTKTVMLAQLGGLFGRIPLIGIAFFVAGLSVIGMPGTPGFDATHLLMEAAMHQFGALITIAAALGNVASAAFLLWSFQRVFLASPGQRPVPVETDSQTKWMESVLAVILIVVQLTAGFYAEPWLKLVDKTAHSMASPYVYQANEATERRN